MGRLGTPAANKVHLIDFGTAKYYQDLKTQKHIPYREKQPLLGTARYMSINTYLGREQSRRDDLEALRYNKKKHTRIGEKKQQATIDDLCAGFPEEFAKCLRYIRGLGFEDQPDYDHLQNLLSQVLKDAGEVDDDEFDWMKVGEGRLTGRGVGRKDSGAGVQPG
ncbi:kinase-like domain-containing protein [Apiosordaria backusii]|uniref:Kinase-like domain-containing protein n=1 Tax=Apiosordaria backusii TaxID=314023 RepID=A0AA40ESR3_9PEZI|nr:kinase-like domain-containing protein [Apiosordaria backusii]